VIEPNSEIDNQQKVDGKIKLGRAKWCLLGCLIIILLLVICSVLIPGRISDAVRWLGDNDFANQIMSIGKQEAALENDMVEMIAENIGISEITSQPMIILKQKNGDIYLPILIGFNEATSIAVILQGVEPPRPLTPDLICSIMDKMGADVEYIVIHDIKDDTFYASIVLNANWTQLRIDSRPSDAIAIALRTKTPIYVTNAVLEEAGIAPDNKPQKYDTAHLKRESQAVSIQTARSSGSYTRD